MWSNEAFAGYLAAMIDGEGHIELCGDCAVRVRIANTVRPTLVAIIERLGFGRVIEYARPKGKNYKRLYCAEVSFSRDIRRMFDICGPYIHMKRDQMDAALAVVDRVLQEVERLDERNRLILSAIKAGEVQNAIAKRFGVSPQTVSLIKRGHKWSSILSGHRARKLAKSFPRSMNQCFRLHGAPE